MKYILHFLLSIAYINIALVHASETTNPKKNISGDTATNDYAAAQKLIRYSVLNEPIADHANLQAWRDGIDMQTINTLFRVSKTWNTCCKELIGRAKKEAIDELKTRFNCTHNIVPMFNAYGDILAITKNIGNGKRHRSVYLYTKKRLYEQELSEPHCAVKNICTCTIEYVNENGYKTLDSTFVITFKDSTHFCTVIPAKPHVGITFDLYIPQGDECTEHFCDAHTKVIQKVFKYAHQKDSNGKDFWDYCYNYNGITRSNQKDRTLLNLEDPFFNDVNAKLKNAKKAYSFLEDEPCGCTHQKVDVQCKEHFKTVCDFLEYNNAQEAKPRLLRTFAQKHILHKIPTCNDHCVYINALGGIVEKQGYKSYYSGYEQHKIKDLRYDIKTLHTVASSYALNWKAINNPHFIAYSRDFHVFKFLYYCSKHKAFLVEEHHLLINEVVKNINDHTLISYKESAPIIVATIKSDNNKLTNVYFYHTRKNTDRVTYISAHEHETIDCLQKFFKSILHYADDAKPCIVLTKSNVADDFMSYAKNLPSYVTAIPDELRTYKLIDKERLYNSALYIEPIEVAEKFNFIVAKSFPRWPEFFVFIKEKDLLKRVSYLPFKTGYFLDGLCLKIKFDEEIEAARGDNVLSWSTAKDKYVHYIFVLNNKINNFKKIILWKNVDYVNSYLDNKTKEITIDPDRMNNYVCASFTEFQKIATYFSSCLNKQFECVVETSDNTIVEEYFKRITEINSNAPIRNAFFSALSLPDIEHLNIKSSSLVIPKKKNNIYDLLNQCIKSDKIPKTLPHAAKSKYPSSMRHVNVFIKNWYRFYTPKLIPIFYVCSNLIGLFRGLVPPWFA